MPTSFATHIAEAAPALAVGSALFAASAVAARRRDMHPLERQAFATVNGVSDRVERAVWPVMQSGSLGAVGVAAAVAARSGRRDAAVALGAAGSVVWGGAKLVKRAFGRGRPADHVEDATVRGRPASGLGFPSGHAAVSMTLAKVACPDLGATTQVAAFGVAIVTALSRVYVGAHLPADVVGGLGLGLVAGAVTNAVRFSLATPTR